MGKISSLYATLIGDRSGVALMEFALSMPLLFTTGLWGLETANQVITRMQVSQLAVQIADNASRIGDTSTLSDRKIYERDINDLLVGANLQGGQRVGLFDHGRVIISSLQVLPDTDDQQFIKWQRCKGALAAHSTYGREGDGTATGLDGMGPSDAKVFAYKGEAVMFVEIAYDYEPLIAEIFTTDRRISAVATFTVRDDRDLSQIYQRDTTQPDPIAACNSFDNAV